MITPGKPRAFPSMAIDPAFGGMSLHDWFAGMALAAMPKLGDTDAGVEGIAHDAWLIADAMIAEREKRK